MQRKSRRSLTQERPLAPPARGALVFAAALTMLAFYAAAIVSMVLLAALLLIGVVVLLGAARVGLAHYIGAMMHAPNRLLTILVTKLWLPAEVSYRIKLDRSDAPKLFEMVADLARRMEVEPPATIVVEMHTGAWVMLKGFRRASGNAMLGVGFDLMAGLSPREVEAVFAHELAHALLVDRGFSRWLNKGLARLSIVAGEMSAFDAAKKQANDKSHLATLTAKFFDMLTVRAARHVATYSRQDEFEADAGAADACGSATLRSALIKLERLHEAAGRLPWGERLARLQPGENFSAWLSGELTRQAKIASDEPVRHAVDPYSTHPSLRDRIAVLPDDDRVVDQAGRGVDLFARPDAIAARLVAEIQRVALTQERRNSKVLAKESKKLEKRESSSPLQLLGIVFFVFGLISGLILSLDNNFAIDGLVVTVLSIAGGVGAYRLGRFRDARPLPIPAYGTITEWKRYETMDALTAAEQAMTTELEAKAAAQSSKKDKVNMLLTTAYAALRDRDYLRAHVASRLTLQLKPKSVEASLGYGIAAAALGNAEQTQMAMGTVKQHAGFASTSTKWGAAWAMVLLDDASSEGFLQQLRDQQPKVATFAGLLAWAQLARGKLQSAIVTARAASALEPENDAITILLIGALLQNGEVAEAARRSASIEDTAKTNAHAAFSLVRVKLLMQDVEGAQRWAQVLRTLDTDGEWLIALGAIFAHSRLDDSAGAFYTDALATMHTPQANVGLAVLAVIGGDRARARQHLLASLKIETKKLSGQTPAAHFHEVVARLNALDERRVECRAWIAAIPEDEASSLSGASLFVCAPDDIAARDHLAEIIAATQRGDKTLDLMRVEWREAPQEQQPLRPVQPGVQGIFS